MESVYIVDGTRTPFCRIGSAYKDMPAAYLASEAVKPLLASTCIKDTDIDEVVFGCVSQPANTMNISRYIAMHSGIDYNVPAVSVHRNCASGMEAITHCASKIRAGEGHIYIAGGVESMTNMPFLYRKTAVEKFTKVFKEKTILNKILSLSKFRVSDFIPEIGLKLGLSDTLCDLNMGQTAEVLAREYSISREEQDKYAYMSHQRACLAKERLEREISPVYVRKNDSINSYDGTVVTHDNGPRCDSTVTKLNTLRPVFDRAGTVTPGNSSQLTDGSVALILMSKKGLKKTGCEPIAKIDSYAYTGCDPKRMGLGPVSAIRALQVNIQSVDLFEINEAFAAQTIACKRLIGKTLGGEIPDEKLNVNGGAIALGHPVGATGARLVLTLLTELKHRDLKTGVASLCIGGGQGGAIWIKTC